MTNHYIPIADAQDPVAHVVAKHIPEFVNKRLPERFNRDEVRTPMQWAPGEGAGFSPPGVTTWLPIDDNRTTRNVATQQDDPGSLLRWYQELLHLRAARPALHAGTLALHDDHGDIVRFEREHDGERITVVANLGGSATTVAVGGPGEILAASSPGVSVRGAVVSLPANSAVVLDRSAR